MAVTQPDLETVRKALNDAPSLRIDYDAETDSLAIFCGEPRPSVAYDVDGMRSILFVPETGEVVGVEVDGWEQRALPQSPELRAVWPSVKEALLSAKWLPGSEPSPDVADSVVRYLFPGGVSRTA
jgi:hypothetical protein